MLRSDPDFSLDKMKSYEIMIWKYLEDVMVQMWCKRWKQQFGQIMKDLKGKCNHILEICFLYII